MPSAKGMTAPFFVIRAENHPKCKFGEEKALHDSAIMI